MFSYLYGSLMSIGRCSVDTYNYYFCSHSYMCKVLSVHSIFQQLPADCLFSELLPCTSPGYNINFDASKHYHTLSMIAHGVLFWFAACQSLLGIITENISPTIKDATFTLLFFFIFLCHEPLIFRKITSHIPSYFHPTWIIHNKRFILI